MYRMSDEVLLGAYEKAVKLNLDVDFVNLLEQEIYRRKLFIKGDLESSVK